MSGNLHPHFNFPMKWVMNIAAPSAVVKGKKLMKDCLQLFTLILTFYNFFMKKVWMPLQRFNDVEKAIH